MDPALIATVPTLNEWGMAMMAGLMLLAATWAIVKRLRSH